MAVPLLVAGLAVTAVSGGMSAMSASRQGKVQAQTHQINAQLEQQAAENEAQQEYSQAVLIDYEADEIRDRATYADTAARQIDDNADLMELDGVLRLAEASRRAAEEARQRDIVVSRAVAAGAASGGGRDIEIEARLDQEGTYRASSATAEGFMSKRAADIEAVGIRRQAWDARREAEILRREADLTNYDADMMRWRGDVRRTGGRNAIQIGQYQSRAARSAGRMNAINTAVSTSGKLLRQGGSLMDKYS